MTSTTLTLPARPSFRIAPASLAAPARLVAKELGIWAAYYGAYLAVRGQTIGSAQAAMDNARDVVAVEEALGVFHEVDVQQASTALQDVLSTYYMLGFAPLVAAVMIWLAVRDRRAMGELRTALLLGVGIASVMYVLFPVAPPRLVPDLGMVDTVGLGAGHDNGSFAGIKFNPYAAMPSMHVGWSLLVGIIGYGVARRRLVRGLFAAHPAVMTVTVVVTGNHYLADAVVGAAVALLALAITRRIARRRSADDRVRPTAVPGEATRHHGRPAKPAEPRSSRVGDSRGAGDRRLPARGPERSAATGPRVRTDGERLPGRTRHRTSAVGAPRPRDAGG